MNWKMRLLECLGRWCPYCAGLKLEPEPIGDPCKLIWYIQVKSFLIFNHLHMDIWYLYLMILERWGTMGCRMASSSWRDSSSWRRSCNLLNCSFISLIKRLSWRRLMFYFISLNKVQSTNYYYICLPSNTQIKANKVFLLKKTTSISRY